MRNARKTQRGFLLDPYRYGTTNPHAETIYAALVSWWDFEENNGTATFLDSHGSNDLSIQTGGSATASSVVGLAGGKVGRSFQPDDPGDRTAYIPRSNTALDLPNSDWSFGGWFNGYRVSGVIGYVMGRYVAGGAQAVLTSNTHEAGFYVFQASSDGTALTTLTSTRGATGGVIATSSHFVVCSLDRANNLLRLRIKIDGAADYDESVAFSGALYTGSSNANFCINDSLSNDSTFLAGDRHMTSGDGSTVSFDSCFYVSKVLSENELLYLYNNFDGVDYATLIADAGV